MDSAITAAWEKVFAEATLDDIDALHAEGWLTGEDFSKRTGISRNASCMRLNHLVSIGECEVKKVRVQIGNTRRETNIYRPRIKN